MESKPPQISPSRFIRHGTEIGLFMAGQVAKGASPSTVIKATTDFVRNVSKSLFAPKQRPVYQGGTSAVTVGMTFPTAAAAINACHREHGANGKMLIRLQPADVHDDERARGVRGGGWGGVRVALVCKAGADVCPGRILIEERDSQLEVVETFEHGQCVGSGRAPIRALTEVPQVVTAALTGENDKVREALSAMDITLPPMEVSRLKRAVIRTFETETKSQVRMLPEFARRMVLENQSGVVEMKTRGLVGANKDVERTRVWKSTANGLVVEDSHPAWEGPVELVSFFVISPHAERFIACGPPVRDADAAHFKSGQLKNSMCKIQMVMRLAHKLMVVAFGFIVLENVHNWMAFLRFCVRYCSGLLGPRTLLFTDRLTGLPEEARRSFAREGLGHRATCAVHLERNMRADCGAKYDSSQFWGIVRARNEEELAARLQAFREKSQKHAAYLDAVPHDEWIQLRILEATGVPTDDKTTTNDVESKHAVEDLARQLPPVDCAVELLDANAKILHDAQEAVKEAQSKNFVTLPHVQKRFSESTKHHGSYIVAAEAGPRGKVYHITKTPDQSAHVDISDPRRLKCSRCLVPRAFEEPCVHIYAYGVQRGFFEPQASAAFYRTYFPPYVQLSVVDEALRGLAIVVPARETLLQERAEDVRLPPVRERKRREGQGGKRRRKFKPGPKGAPRLGVEKRIPSIGEIQSSGKRKRQKRARADSDAAAASAASAAAASSAPETSAAPAASAAPRRRQPAKRQRHAVSAGL